VGARGASRGNAGEGGLRPASRGAQRAKRASDVGKGGASEGEVRPAREPGHAMCIRASERCRQGPPFKEDYRYFFISRPRFMLQVTIAGCVKPPRSLIYMDGMMGRLYSSTMILCMPTHTHCIKLNASLVKINS
jgi:hypothetical protein